MPSETSLSHARRRVRAVVAAVVTALAVGVVAAPQSPASAAGNPVTPGAFTGYGFDQCTAPTQDKMTTWLASSPFRAVGIYISGASRGCREQPNLSPTWIATQLATGWHLLPITLGPQASCNSRFPRYGNDPVIDSTANAAGQYLNAAAQGTQEANTTVAAAQALGIVPGSTMYYDLEGFDATRTGCRESSLWFLSAWTQQLHALGYVSGVYSSAGSGITMLDDARVLRPGAFVLPDQIWIARWDGQADTSTTYISDDGWQGNRIKQYQGGHDETWGGATINIDRNYLALSGLSTIPPTTPTLAGTPEPTHCHGTDVDLSDYGKVKRPAAGRSAPDPGLVSALKCLLKERGVYRGRVEGAWTARLTSAVHTWQHRRGLSSSGKFTRRAWMTLLAAGSTRSVHVGSSGEKVRRVQRALNAASRSAALPVTGRYDGTTQAAIRTWQQSVGLHTTGEIAKVDWAALQAGRR